MAHKQRTALVKLTRPRLFDAVHRPRLYNLLDLLLQHPLVWITGPPGAGRRRLSIGAPTRTVASSVRREKCRMCSRSLTARLICSWRMR